ncbi:MAG: cytidine deaminase [Bacteroidia bacterium]|jgi:cytidine deaminase|nr:cytidine deaminase [Bacteroidia bacterium]
MQKKIIETHVTVLNHNELSAEEAKLIEKAREQVSKSYAPYSKFSVGAAVLLENGEVFAGSNQENSAYPSGLCAERVAMFYANAQYPDVAVKSLAITAFSNGEFVQEPITPCGSCRQVLIETENRFEKEITVFLDGKTHLFRLENVKELLPLAFSKTNLLP